MTPALNRRKDAPTAKMEAEGGAGITRITSRSIERAVGWPHAATSRPWLEPARMMRYAAERASLTAASIASRRRFAGTPQR